MLVASTYTIKVYTSFQPFAVPGIVLCKRALLTLHYSVYLFMLLCYATNAKHIYRYGAWRRPTCCVFLCIIVLLWQHIRSHVHLYMFAAADDRRAALLVCLSLSMRIYVNMSSLLLLLLLNEFRTRRRCLH